MGADQEQNKGQINIFARNIRGTSKGETLFEAKTVRNTTGGQFYQNGNGGGVNNDKNKPRKPTSVTEVKTIICETALEDGAENDESGKITKKGIVHGHSYTFKVTEYTNGEPKDKSKIKWMVGYQSPEDSQNKWIENNLSRPEEATGERITITFGNNTDMCGTNLVVKAYIVDKEKGGTLPIWKHNRFRWFDGKIFEKGLQARKTSAKLIDQSATSLCGTAAILYLFAKSNPDLFYKAYKTFFRTGESKINNFSVLPAEEIYEMKPSKDNDDYPHFKSRTMMPQTDWVTLVGTRSSDNKDYTGKDGEDWDAINWPSYMVKAAKELYNATEVHDETHIITGFDYSTTLQSIEKDFIAGWKIILLIDSDMLDDNVSYMGSLTNYHWIVYNGGLIIDPFTNSFIFSYYCWAREYNAATIRTKVFNTNFYGYIKFK